MHWEAGAVAATREDSVAVVAPGQEGEEVKPLLVEPEPVMTAESAAAMVHAYQSNDTRIGSA